MNDNLLKGKIMNIQNIKRKAYNALLVQFKKRLPTCKTNKT